MAYRTTSLTAYCHNPDLPFDFPEEWTVTFKVIASGDLAVTTKASMIDTSFFETRMGFEDDMAGFYFSEINFDVHDAVHSDDFPSLWSFIFCDWSTDTSTDREVLVEFRLFGDLQFTMAVDKSSCVYKEQNSVLSIRTKWVTSFESYPFADTLDPLNVIGMSFGSLLLIDAIEKAMALLTGSETVDVQDVSILCRGMTDHGTGLDYATFDEIRLDDDLHSHLIGNYVLSDDMPTVKDFLRQIAILFQLRIGVDEFGTSYIVQKYKADAVEIDDGMIIGSPEILNFVKKRGSHVLADAPGGPSDFAYGDVRYDGDGNVSNLDQINDYHEVLRYDPSGGLTPTTVAGHFCIQRANAGGSPDPIYTGWETCEIDDVTGENYGDFIPKIDWAVISGLQVYIRVSLRGTDWNVFQNYRLRKVFPNGGYIYFEMIPKTITKNKFKHETMLEGMAIMDAIEV